MIACLDVHYFEQRARAAAVVFADWSSTEPVAEYTATLPAASDYQPGRLFLRELEPLLEVVGRIGEDVDRYIVDGYCHLSADRAPGLGVHLWRALDRRPTVLGVAKNRFRVTGHAVEVVRASSRRPLFVTAVGVDYEQAASWIESMAGPFRIPTLLRRVDRLARSPQTGGLGG